MKKIAEIIYYYKLFNLDVKEYISLITRSKSVKSFKTK